MEHIIDGLTYVETDEKGEVGDFVISSEQIGQPRIYEVYHAYEDNRIVLGKYSRGHSLLSNYKTLKLKK